MLLKRMRHEYIDTLNSLSFFLTDCGKADRLSPNMLVCKHHQMWHGASCPIKNGLGKGGGISHLFIASFSSSSSIGSCSV